MSRSKFKGTKFDEPFVGIVRSVFESRKFVELSPHATKLLLELLGQFRGDNNGNLTVAWTLMSKRGWKSRTTLWRCKSELIEAGFVYETRKGRLPKTCALLALTWFPLDVSPKFDHEALACFEAKAYRSKAPLPMPAIKTKPDWTLPNGGRTAQPLVHVRNIEAATSPPLEHYKRLKPVHSLPGGLVGQFSENLNVH